MAFTYIVRCADDSLYVGHTEDLRSREEIHNGGHGGKYTASRLPVRMVYAEEHATVERAVARERQIKRWTEKKKEALIAGERLVLRTVGRRKSRRVMAAFTWRDLLNRQS